MAVRCLSCHTVYESVGEYSVTDPCPDHGEVYGIYGQLTRYL